jgi:hypothetical protein
MRGRSIARLLAALVLVSVAAAPRAAGSYMEDVTFSFDENKITYNGGISTAYLLLDTAGGLNPLWKARPMKKQGSVWSVTVKLAEGDYIYVFVANADQYVNLSDCNLNEDDVPDSNFFLDPNPKFQGFGGQYGKDNVFEVRDPLRPQYIKTSPSPKPGTLYTGSAPVVLTTQAKPGTGGTPIDPKKVKAKLHVNEPPGMFRTAGAPPPDTTQDVQKVSVTAGAGGVVTVTATLENPPEGFHEVDFEVADTSGRTGDTFTVAVLINRQNQPPTADPGPTRFGHVGGEVELDGGSSSDPDRVGIKTFSWRQVSGPGSLTFRAYDQERDTRDSFVVLLFDDEGNGKQNLVAGPSTGALDAGVSGVRVTPTAPGTYKIGLKVQDHQGAWSTERLTEVHVVSAFSAAVRPRVDVTKQGQNVLLDGRPTGASGAYKWYQDAGNPAQVTLSPQNSGRSAAFPVPAQAGAYFFYLQVGDSYPRTAVVRVGQSGDVTGQELDDQDAFWKNNAVIYMVFVRMFHSSSGGGGGCGAVQGDFQGLIQKLPYLKELGVNVLWIMPITPGPTTHGYAATALFDVEPDYGSLSDWDAFTQAAHKMGFKVMFDLVANHTSDQHPMFRAALANEASPLRDWYVFNPGNQTRPFEYAFDFSTLPSLNYNNPQVRGMMLDMVEFWLDHGVDAFRCDIASFVPPSFWRAMRRRVVGRRPGGAMLAEIIPPSVGFFDEQFELAYHSYLYWNFKDIFAKTGGLDSFNNAMTSQETFIQNGYVKHVREKVDPANVLTMRYLDTQDEDRFLLQAGRKVEVLKAAAATLLTMPGTPMIYYGDEQGLEQGRGQMLFGDDGDKDLHDHYQRVLRVRNENPGLRGQDVGALCQPGDTFTRINNDGDKGGAQVYSFARYRSGQLFVVLSNRFASGSLGTPVTFYAPTCQLDRYGAGTLWLINHLDPKDRLATDKTSLTNGFTASVGSHETKVYQVAEAAIPDHDGDAVLDSYDNCPGVANPGQEDSDGDHVGDDCDGCDTTPPGTPVGLDGCGAQSGAARARYSLDGKVDDVKYKLASASGLDLHASFNGRLLYVAATAAKPGSDVVVYVTAPGAAKRAAGLGKQGKVAFGGWLLADEGDGNYADWVGVTGAAAAASPKMAEAGVVEGTLNLTEIFGGTLPTCDPKKPPCGDKILPACEADKPCYCVCLAAVRYGTADNAPLDGQVPAAKVANGDVESSELLAFRLETSASSGPQKESDVDSDGVPDINDNCPGVPNSSQEDFDSDGVGDLCDLCPATRPGAPVDGFGCERDPGQAHPNPNPDLSSGPVQEEGCAVAPARAPASFPALLLLALLGLLRKKQ